MVEKRTRIPIFCLLNQMVSDNPLLVMSDSIFAVRNTSIGNNSIINNTMFMSHLNKHKLSFINVE